MIGFEMSKETHPFFHNRAIPHRAVKLIEIGDDVEVSSQLANSNHFHSRKTKSGPLVERPSNTHLPQPTPDDSSIDAKSAAPLVVESSMEKTPKKKVLKLSSNGKLLSSPMAVPVGLPITDEPTTILPKVVSKRTKARYSKSGSSSLIAKIGYGRDDSDGRLRIGSTISKVLSSTHGGDLSEESSTAKKKKRTPKKSTHPFFFGNVKPLSSAAGENGRSKGRSQVSDVSFSPAKGASKRQSPQSKPAWKDIVFSPSRTASQQSEASPAPWPPLILQRVDDLQHSQKLDFHITSSIFPTYKSKGRATQLPQQEDVLLRASHTHFESMQGLDFGTARHPARKVLSGDEMSCRLENKLLVDRIHLATQRLKTSLNTTLTAFDQGKCDQSSWTTKSSPLRAEEVLQSGPEAVVLRDWVKKLTVTSVEGAQPADKPKVIKPHIRKRGRPKRTVEVDDFIISSGDDDDELTEIDQSTRESSPFIDDMKRSVLRAGAMTSSQDKEQTKNAILVSGPTGCGKTASVYAVAKELDFEVFEIHPGSRRGAKEILEKVGDMTQNHLVQQQSGETSPEEVPATPIDEAAVQNEIASGKQRTMNGFFQAQTKIVSGAGRKRKAVQQDDQKEESTMKKPRKTQKQSLILLEEVDVLFEDDKSFWNGVMSLINQSKRPIILTCNDESALPLKELPLHGILRYSPPPEDMVTDYLLTLAASEGHELERDAVSYLYRSQKFDLRATITELDFWCQMGIGSRKGGLDWMLDKRGPSAKPAIDGARPRVFSTNTYLRGMGLTSLQPEMESDQLVFNAYQQLDIPIDTWCAEADRTFGDCPTIRDASTWADLYSDFDLCQQMPFDTDPSDLQLRIAVSLTTRLSSKPPTSTDIIDVHVQKPQPPKLTRSTLNQIFEPLANEKSTFPPSQGRLAPSLDSPTSTITTDLAPYIRSIVAFEQKWGATLPAPKRNTRASARPEGHFPKKTNAKHVLMTGGERWQDLWVKREESGCVDEELNDD
jgi:DNA polymerase III delta prime subunit